MTTTDTSNRPALACDLTALTPEERERHAGPWKQMRALAPEPEATASGVAFRRPRPRWGARHHVRATSLGRRGPILRGLARREGFGH